MKTLLRAKIINSKDLTKIRYPLPKSLTDVAGIWKGRRIGNPIVYQRRIRKEWEKRTKKLEKLWHSYHL